MYTSLNKNLTQLRLMFADSADLTIRELRLRSDKNALAALITIEGMCDKEVLAASVMNPLLAFDFGSKTGDELAASVRGSVLSSAEMIEVIDFDEAANYAVSGFAVLAFDGCKKMLAVGVQGYAFRGVEEPESEVVQRGSREGFCEPLRINMSLIRRRIKSPDLVFELMSVGEKSKTQLMLCYLKSRASEKLIQTVRTRVENCDLEAVLGAGYLSEYLEDDGGKSIFSGVGISERPDTICGKLIEGRIAVIVDGTPAVMIVPRLFVEEFQAVDDYSNRPYYATFIRALKYMAIIISVYLPGIYTAFAQYHPEYFPTWILIKTSESISHTPLPVTLEVLLIAFVYEIMKEAGLRIPKSLGHAVSIVGALVIGESAVNAGIISASTLMVVAVAAICSYVTSPLYPPVMTLRFLFIIVGGMIGLWGIVLASCVVVINMCSKTSLGIPYLSSLSPFAPRTMRDVVLRAPWKTLSKHTIRVQNFPETEDE